MKQHIKHNIVRPFILLFLFFGLASFSFAEPSDYFDTVEDVVTSPGTTVGGLGLGEINDVLAGPEDGTKVLMEYWPILMEKVQSVLESVPGGGVVWDRINSIFGDGRVDGALKALEIIGHVADFAGAGIDIAQAYMDDDQDAFEDAVFNLSEMIVIKLGEWAGSHFGPSIGAQIGTIINPGLGTALGWIGGTIWGDDLGGKLGEWIIGFFEDDIKNLAGRLYARLKDGGGGSDAGGSGPGTGGNSLDIPVDASAGADQYTNPYTPYAGPGGDFGPGGAGINGGNGNPTANPVAGSSPDIDREQPIEDLGE